LDENIVNKRLKKCLQNDVGNALVIGFREKNSPMPERKPGGPPLRYQNSDAQKKRPSLFVI
jgi:hypothetical protein